jgi:hypothetical protein
MIMGGNVSWEKDMAEIKEISSLEMLVVTTLQQCSSEDGGDSALRLLMFISICFGVLLATAASYIFDKLVGKKVEEKQSAKVGRKREKTNSQETLLVNAVASCSLVDQNTYIVYQQGKQHLFRDCKVLTTGDQSRVQAKSICKFCWNRQQENVHNMIEVVEAEAAEWLMK